MADHPRTPGQRVYFDTQQWNYLIDPDTGCPHPEHALRRVQQAVKAGQIEVVGSLDLLQELIEARPRRPKKSRQMTDLFFKLVGDRILLPLSERHPKEAMAGGLLSEESRCLPSDFRREVRRLAQSGRDVLEVAETLYTEKVEFLENENAVQKQMRERLTEMGATDRTRLMRDWIASVDIDDWVREITETGRRQGRAPNHATARTGNVPSVGAFVAFRLGRLAMTMGEGRKIQDSDLADAHHVACGPYVDLFVTDDRELRNTLDLVRDRLSFEWMSSPDFFAAIL